jgi:hypothetical protein
VGVIIGMDPHKRSATIEVMDERAKVVAEMTPARPAIRTCSGRAEVRRPGLGDRGLQRGSPPHRAPPRGQRRDGDGRARQAVGAGTGLRHRQRPQDRPGRRALGRAGNVTIPNLVQVEVDPDLAVLGMLPGRRDEAASHRGMGVGGSARGEGKPPCSRRMSASSSAVAGLARGRRSRWSAVGPG